MHIPAPQKARDRSAAFALAGCVHPDSHHPGFIARTGNTANADQVSHPAFQRHTSTAWWASLRNADRVQYGLRSGWPHLACGYRFVSFMAWKARNAPEPYLVKRNYRNICSLLPACGTVNCDLMATISSDNMP